MMGVIADDVMVITKKDSFSDNACTLAKLIFGEGVHLVSGQSSDKIPEDIARIKPKVLISFLSPWIIPKYMIDNARLCINFHPASRDYPGIGCYNFALYEQAREFGAICHFMAEKVDTGDIIQERRFPVFDTDTVESLKLRTMITMLAMYHDIISDIACGNMPHPCGLQWSRRPFTRRELNDLTVIEEGMEADEVKRRIRATTYPGYPGASVTVGGETFIYPVPDRKPLA